MTALLSFDHFDVFRVEKVTAVIASGTEGLFAVFSPEISLSDIMIIGNGDARAVAEEFFKG